jgi:cephalosporin hydroxylase
MDDIKKFELFRQKNINSMAKNKKFQKIAREFTIETDKNKYEYNFNWLGRPIIQFPQDIVALQEIVWKVKPDLIIETGIAHGGSLIFYASILELIGRGEVLGIDIDIKKHNRKEIEKHKMFKRITMIEGSSISHEVIEKVKDIVKKHKKILVCLDSLHTHKHVLEELNLYSKFVSKGNYIIVMDTSIELMPKGYYKNRPWDKGNNPATAVKSFLKKNKNFVVDKEIENKLLITSSPGGYLKRVR